MEKFSYRRRYRYSLYADYDGWLSYRRKFLDHWIRSVKISIIYATIGGMQENWWWIMSEKNVKLNMEQLMKLYFSKNTNHKHHSGEDQDFLTINLYDKYFNNTIVYIRTV